ncbi:MAG TPA: cupin domain-containing protein [Thermoanaerobaculia bacterium]|jgi:anti-sigma factor ChrR (cupin superfamily)|nr:cupin domain-containing protein [Thermoanaerobaculia bacterium]
MKIKLQWFAASLLAMVLLSVPAALALEDAKPDAAAKKGASSKTAAPKAPDHAAITAADMKWGDGPPSLAAGAKLAVLEGDPGKAQAFTIRLRVPDGYRVAPHWHPTTEHVTVISGTFHIAMGDKFDDTKGTALGPGSFAFMAAKMHHYAWFTGDSEIQIHGIGPFALNYVNPADDPRHAKK